MLLRLSFFLIIFSTSFATAQTVIDSVLSLTFPGNVEKFEKTEDNMTVKGFYFNTELESFVVLRLSLLEDTGETSPTNNLQLDEIYKQQIKALNKSMLRKSFLFKDSSKITLKNRVAYNLKYNVVNTEEVGAESILIFINGVHYVITYSKVSEFNEANKIKFFKSIEINEAYATNQIEPNKKNYFKIIKYSIYILMILALVIYQIKATKNKSKFGINLKTNYCPICNTRQPKIRFPNSLSQALFGGSSCPNCKSHLDKYGNIIS
ncbi:hypothetical protein [Lacihabitans soyangensis]|uniref:Uncharacterized protein n=1 Tax=Lacihabitans soyangensis TaxID=869394 RepID=A0AAE3KXD7_9BACT|nr:hypothetical protein [Lacihabitans soyangensis]MCP9764755.1 hypothetical protein [Lacihabitans soyangensis]